MIDLAVVSTVKHPGPSFATFLRYHLHAGVGRMYLFFEDPNDPALALCDDDRLQITVLDEQLRVQQRKTAAYQQYGQEAAFGELMSRQMMNVELALQQAAKDGVQWLAHIDVDEILWHPERSLTDWVQSQPDTIQQLIVLNYEAAPESTDIDNIFHRIRYFKQNQQCLAAGQLASYQARYNRPWFYLAYQNGKSIVRLQAGLMAGGVHRFAFQDGRQFAVAACHVSIKEPCLLHYVNCGLNHYRAKYQTRGRFNRQWWNRINIPLPFHLASGDALEQDSEATLTALYEQHVQYANAEERAWMQQNGLLLDHSEVKLSLCHF